MKPTDEAERLREEIALTISNSEPFNSEYFDDFDYKLIGSIAEKSINKVLDAAIEGIARVYIEQKLDGPFIIYQDTINKLRP